MADQTGALAKFFKLLETNKIRYCVIGGQGINAYVEPLVSLDLDLVIDSGQLEKALQLLSHDFQVQRFPHTVNLSLPGSDLRIQIQIDERYFDFLHRSEMREVLGLKMPVANIRDLLLSKVWAVMDASRRASKRQKDLADIGRILEAYPDLRSEVPVEIVSRLF